MEKVTIKPTLTLGLLILIIIIIIIILWIRIQNFVLVHKAWLYFKVANLYSLLLRYSVSGCTHIQILSNHGPTTATLLLHKFIYIVVGSDWLVVLFIPFNSIIWYVTGFINQLQIILYVSIKLKDFCSRLYVLFYQCGHFYLSLKVKIFVTDLFHVWNKRW